MKVIRLMPMLMPHESESERDRIEAHEECKLGDFHFLRFQSVTVVHLTLPPKTVSVTKRSLR